MGIEQGSKVRLDYTGTLDDGTIFDCSEAHGEPLEFVYGVDRLIKGFEDAILGMEAGQEKDVHIEPDDAYGQVNEELFQKVPIDSIPAEDLEIGVILGMELPDGSEIPATISDISETEITIDLNHPLAGKALNFNLKIIEVN